MCLAVPARVIKLDVATQMAIVDLAGIQKEMSTTLVDDLNEGDYVLVHVGFALHKLSEEEAAQTLALFDELEALNESAPVTEDH